MTRNDDPNANAHVRRQWLIEARSHHELSKDEAALLVKARKNWQHLTEEELERAIEGRRVRRGLSQPDLAILVAEKVGSCSQNEICKIETGERQRPKPQYVEALAKILHMTRDEVLYGSPKPKKARVLGEVAADETIRMYTEEKGAYFNGFTPDADMACFRVAADLEPPWRQSDILHCPGKGATLEECIGRWCVAKIDARLYVGFIERGASARIITLRPSRTRNPTLIDRTPTWISPIIAITLTGGVTS